MLSSARQEQTQGLQKGKSKIRNVLVRVRVTPNAKEVRVTKVGEANFEVKVDESARDGKANKRLLEIMSNYFEVPKSRIRIVSGTKSRDKTLEITLNDSTKP